MTVEELEILVTAKTEEAIKEVMKIIPAIKQATKQTQEAFSKIDTKEMKNKVQQTVNFIKKKVQDFKKSTENSKVAIKVTNDDAHKQITQIEKEIDSLQKKISARELKLNITNNALDKMRYDTNQQVTKEMPDAGAKRIGQRAELKLATNDNYMALVKQSDKLNNEIIRYNTLLDGAKAKMKELGQETSQTTTTQSKMSSFFSGFKAKIGQVLSSSKGLKSTFNQMPKITQNITNNIRGMGTHLKGGLKHIISYAGALLSLRGIYGMLTGCANAWLSSQNVGAKQLSANIDYMKYAMGSALAPVIQFVTNLVYQLMKAIQSVAYALTGVNIFAKASASSYASMAGSAKKAKEETKQLAGIHDEINNVQTNKNNDSGSGGGTAPSFDLSQMDNTPNSIINAIKNGNWYEVGATIGQKLNDAMNSIPWDKIQNTARKIGTGIAQTLNGFIATTDWNQVGNTFAQGLNTVIYIGQSFVNTFDFSNFGKSIGTSLSSFIGNIDWGALGNTLSSGIKGIFNTISGFFETFDWSVVVNGLLDFISGFDWNGVSDAIFQALGSACASLVNLGMVIGEKINEALDEAKNYFQEKIEECGGNVVAGIFKGIVDAIAGIGQWINEHIFQPFIEGFKNAFGIHSPSTVMEEQGNFIVEGLKNGLSNIWETISSIFVNLKDRIIEKFTEIKTNLGQWVENTKNTIKDWANQNGEKIKNWCSNAKNNISEAWGNISNKVNEKVTTVKNDISVGFSNAKNTILNWCSNVKNSWGNNWNTMANQVNSGLNTAKNHISKWGSNLGSTFSDLGRNALTWGRDLVGNIASGIRNNISKVTSAVSSVANNIKGYLHFTEPDVGPLSNFHTYMPDMIDLMVNGIHSNMGKITNELENLTSTMSYTINSPDISPIPFENTKNNTVQLRSSILDNLSDMLNSNEQNVNITIPLTVQVGNKKLGQILLDDLKDMKRRTGKDIEALVGG